ncbi:hypothetical protein C8Q73DRAFT_188562 [Cubamyces lactineus]|nr:hypothetical protein C8Q73DRAFT_188562 [Cubamyces lactineus]
MGTVFAAAVLCMNPIPIAYPLPRRAAFTMYPPPRHCPLPLPSGPVPYRGSRAIYSSPLSLPYDLCPIFAPCTPHSPYAPGRTPPLPLFNAFIFSRIYLILLCVPAPIFPSSTFARGFSHYPTPTPSGSHPTPPLTPFWLTVVHYSFAVAPAPAMAMYCTYTCALARVCAGCNCSRFIFSTLVVVSSFALGQSGL